RDLGSTTLFLAVEPSDAADARSRLWKRLEADAVWKRGAGVVDLGSGIQRLVSYLVRSTPSGNVRVSTRFRFTQLSRAVDNGLPPPGRQGWVTIPSSSTSPARMAAAARVAPPTSMGPPSSVLSRVISLTASPVTRRAFQSTARVVEENTTFGMSRQRRANANNARVEAGLRAGRGAAGRTVSPTQRPWL